MTTVFAVNCPVFEYNDEGYYEGETDATLAICATSDVAWAWVKKHGWDHIGYAMEDPGECMVENELFEGGWGEYHDWSDPAKRAKALKQYFSVKEVEVLT